MNDRELKDYEVALLARHARTAERRDMWQRELRSRAKWRLIQRLPNPTGVCRHGNRVEWDQRGAYSSGYPMGCDRCRTTADFDAIVNDPPSPEQQRILDSIARLRER